MEGYLGAVGATTQAVVYGLVLTALAQGALAGPGWATGLPARSRQTAAGVGLLLRGTLVVSWVDNLIRPMMISSASRTPFLLVMFGVLGGVAAYGLIGLFVGPVILAVVMAVWREWLGEQSPAGAEAAHRPTPSGNR